MEDSFYDCKHSCTCSCVSIYLLIGAFSWFSSFQKCSSAGFFSMLVPQLAKGFDFPELAIYTDGTRSADGETLTGLGAVARSPDGMLLVFVWVLSMLAHMYSLNSLANSYC